MVPARYIHDVMISRCGDLAAGEADNVLCYGGMRIRLSLSVFFASVSTIVTWTGTSAPAQVIAGSGKFAMPKAPKGQPAPRTADGHVDFSGVYHSPGYGPGDPRAKSGDTTARNIARDLDRNDIPMLPSAQEEFAKRAANNQKDDPQGHCMPMGTPRKDPYPWQILQTPTHLFFLYEGNVHSYRQVFIDGRPHNSKVVNTWWGDSIGSWDGDSLVVDTVGFNNKAWLDGIGHLRTDKAHIIERYSRPELARVVIEITIDDPGAYSRPWSVTQVAQLAPGWDLIEYICNENNKDLDHLVGK